MPYKEGIWDAKSTRAPAPIVWNGRGAALRIWRWFHHFSKNIAPGGPGVCQKRHVPRARRGRASPFPAARPGQVLSRSLRSSPPLPGSWPLTRTAPAEAARPPPPRPGPGSRRCFCIFGTVLVSPFTAAFWGGHRCRPTLAVRRRGVPAAGRLRGPLGRERATTHPAQRHRRGPGRCQGAASAQRPTPTPRPSPPCEGSWARRRPPRRADPSHAGQTPHTHLPAPPGRGSARSRGTPAVCRAAAANTYPESFPIFTKLNTSIHAAG